LLMIALGRVCGNCAPSDSGRWRSSTPPPDRGGGKNCGGWRASSTWPSAAAATVTAPISTGGPSALAPSARRGWKCCGRPAAVGVVGWAESSRPTRGGGFPRVGLEDSAHPTTGRSEVTAMVFRALFDKIKQGLAKTRSVFSGVASLFRLKGRVDKDFLSQLEEKLYLADVGTAATSQIVEQVRQ